MHSSKSSSNSSRFLVREFNNRGLQELDKDLQHQQQQQQQGTAPDRNGSGSWQRPGGSQDELQDLQQQHHSSHDCCSEPYSTTKPSLLQHTLRMLRFEHAGMSTELLSCNYDCVFKSSVVLHAELLCETATV
jgi:hypothetical protein